MISLEQARLFALHHQGLLQPRFDNGKAGALQAIQQLGYLQLDTLSVVVRAHHHTLWSRVPEYKELYLNELVEKDKTVFEYWAHAASFLPMSDYRFSLIRKQAYKEGKSHWFEQNKELKRYVLDRITNEGALQSKDFEHKRTTPSNWYEWKPAKQALEQLFMEGSLMIAKRQGFQKVYDLTERVLPSTVDTTMPTPEEYALHLIENQLLSYGFVHESELAYLRNSKTKQQVKTLLKSLLKEGKLVKFEIQELGNSTSFITMPQYLENVDKLASTLPKTKTVQILSPFDNTVIQRKRVQRLFNFDYQIECYVPEPKRKFGYFCLPVLYDNQLVARFDAKADRASKTFYIKSFYLESNFKDTDDFKQAFVQKLTEFAAFDACTQIVSLPDSTKWAERK